MDAPAQINDSETTPPALDEPEVVEETERDENGAVVERRRWRGGALHGDLETYHPDGQVQTRQPFVDGQLHGRSEIFSPSGQLLQQSHFEDGQLHGPLKTFTEDGHPQQTAHYEDGRLHGDMVLYAPPDPEAESPQVLQQATMVYREGLLEGPLATYDARQQPTFQVPYLAGLREGLATWFQDGVMVRQGTYVADQLHGELLSYHPNGRVRERVPYENDQPHGIAVRYYKNGKVKEKLRYHRGEQVGDSVEYSPKGERYDAPRRGGR